MLSRTFTAREEISMPGFKASKNRLLFFFIFFKCLFVIERQSMSRGGAEREDTESEAGSRL